MKDRIEQKIETTTITDKQIVLTNSTNCIEKKICPYCNKRIKSTSVRVRKCADLRYPDKMLYLYLNSILYCMSCNVCFFSQDKYYKANEKAYSRFRVNGYIHPSNIEEIIHTSKKDIFLPKSMFTGELLFQADLIDEVYKLTEEELVYAIDYYRRMDVLSENVSRKQNSELSMRNASILGEMGYSTKLTDEQRRCILEACVQKHRRFKVIRVLEFNIRMRELQQDSYRFEHAIAVWRNDIRVVNEIADEYDEMEMRLFDSKHAESLKNEPEENPVDKSVFWWENRE